MSRTRLLPTPPIPPKLQAAIWKQCGWAPHDLQRKVLLSPVRQRLIAAGRRTGKSQIGGYALVPEAFRAQQELAELRSRKLRREFWIVGPEYSDAEKEFRVAWEALTALGFEMDRPGSYNNPEAGEMRISMFRGRFIIHAKSAKYPGTLVGEGLSGVVFAEAAKLKPSVYNKFLRPTLADFGGWALFGSTPEGRNWFYDFWNNGQDAARRDWASWRAPSWANPYVYPTGVDEPLLARIIEFAREPHKLAEFLERVPHYDAESGRVPVGIDSEIWSMFLDMSLELFNQEVQALFTEFVGRVFKDFDEEVHVTDDDFHLDWRTYACVDYGFTNPFVWLVVQVDPTMTRVHVVREYYETQRTTGEAAREILSRGLGRSRGVPILKFFPDPAEPDRSRDLANALGIPAGSGTGIALDDRLEWIRRFLKMGPPSLPLGHPGRYPYLTINRSCINTIREFGAYRYPETAEQAAARARPREAPEAPLKRDDHTPEALGRLFSGLFGSPWTYQTGTVVDDVVVGRR